MTTRIEDMDTQQLDAYINDLKASPNKLHEIDLVSAMQIRLGMQELGVETVQELLARVPLLH